MGGLIYFYLVPLILSLVSCYLIVKFEWYSKAVNIASKSSLLVEIICSFIPVVNIVVAATDLFLVTVKGIPKVLGIIETKLSPLVEKFEKLINSDHLR